MKKILIGLSFAVLAVACTQPKEQKAAGSKSVKVASRDTMPESAITLNGLDMKTANLMAEGFNENGNTTSKTLSFWLSREWVNNIYELLFKKYPDADGVRFYMGLVNGKNTIIITATKEAGDNDFAVSGKDHKDYFFTDADFLTKPAAHDSAEYTPGVGSTLYDPALKCPDNGCGIELTNHVSCDTAHMCVQNFMKTAITINTLSEWYPKTLIENVFKELNEANLAKVPADGFRLYLGKNTGNRVTFIIVTTKSEGGVHKDYYECYYKKNGRGDDFDHGEECPVNCGFVTWPRDGETPNP